MSRHTWADLFERAAAHEADVEAIRDALAARRAGGSRTGDATGRADRDERKGCHGREDGDGEGGREERAARVVADADVLAADLLAGGDAGPSVESGEVAGGDAGSPARGAMDLVRAHSWLTLVASDPLLDDAEAVVAALADPDLAADWRATVEALATVVDQPAGDHPALASALHGDAAHLLSYDDALLGPEAGAALRGRLETSVRRPSAFVRVFDAAALHEAVVGGDYPGPDRDPRG